jgi:hypothetical protein
MCCWTHEDLSYPGALASTDVDDRCRCECLPPCRRRATAEDVRCDVCGGRASSDPAQGGGRTAQVEPQSFERSVTEREYPLSITLPGALPATPGQPF